MKDIDPLLFEAIKTQIKKDYFYTTNRIVDFNKNLAM